MMTTTTILAYLLIVCYFVIERKLRKGEKALSLTAGPFDLGSSRIMWASGVFSIVLVLVAPILNAYQLGYWSSVYMSWFGLLIMLGGLILRYWAAKTLNEFYTRTLQIVEGHRIVDQPPYNILRHPGYLGVFLMEIGACLAIAGLGCAVDYCSHWSVLKRLSYPSRGGNARNYIWRTIQSIFTKNLEADSTHLLILLPATLHLHSQRLRVSHLGAGCLHFYKDFSQNFTNA